MWGLKSWRGALADVTALAAFDCAGENDARDAGRVRVRREENFGG